VYGFTINDGHIQLSMYFDTPAEDGLAHQYAEGATKQSHAEPAAAPDPAM